MNKRFTDKDIWEDPWFRRLPCLYKEFWRFLCDKSDPAGVWKVDLEAARFFLGEDISEKRALEAYNDGKERVEVLDPGKWWLPGFISFQYGELSPNCNYHRPVYDALIRNGISLLRVNQGLNNPSPTLMDKDKDKDKSKSPLKKKEYPETFLAFWRAYPNKVGKDKAADAWAKQAPNLEACLAALKWQTQQPQWTKDGGRFIPHPATWLNQGRWADERVAVTPGNGAAPIPGKYDGIGESV